MKNYVFHLLRKYDHDWNKIYKGVKQKELVRDEDIEEYKDYEDFFTILDDDYPEMLKETSTPPFVLFYEGNRDILKNMNYSTLAHGGDRLTIYGKNLCKKIIQKARETKSVVITCEWTKCGQYLIEEGRRKQVPLVIVLGQGRATNRTVKHIESDNEIFVSLFLDDVELSESKQESALWLASALCYRCIISEIELSRKKLKLIDNCLEQGKKVYAYPTNVTNYNQGSNYLIKQGASILM